MTAPALQWPECSECSKPATHYEKDSSPRNVYCGRHAGKWAKRGIQMREFLLPEWVRLQLQKGKAS